MPKALYAMNSLRLWMKLITRGLVLKALDVINS